MVSASQSVSVVGSGPNGLTAAVILARSGQRVTVYEGFETIGGGCRTEQLTLPGFLHDSCSAVHPLGVSSPAFREIGLGVQWAHAELPLAHPLDDGRCAYLPIDMDEAVAALGKDGSAYRALMEPFVERWDSLLEDLLAPPHLPSHPLIFGGFAMQAVKSAAGIACSRFNEATTKAIFAGMAAHAMVELDSPGSAAFGLVLGAALHAVGWPLAIGGSTTIADKLRSDLESMGGTILTGRPIRSPSDLPNGDPVVLTMTPRQLLSFGGENLPAGYRNSLNQFRYGRGVCKVDWALSDPIPWSAEPCRRALTVHVGGTLEEIASSASQTRRGNHPDSPYVIVVQPTLVDRSRAPEHKHVGWAYCHVPANSRQDYSEAIEKQVERFAPGFRDCILKRHVRTAEAMERYNPCYVGGDIGAGAQNLRQTLFRPVVSLNPHRMPVNGWYICSASTPPGGGVHGMNGLHAARLLWKDLYG